MPDPQQDKQYLRDEKYAETEGLDTRVQIQAQHRSALEPWFQWVFTRLALEAGALVLDIGCGPGYIWHNNRHRLPSGLQLVLSDLSHSMVTAARRRLLKLPAATNYLVADGQALPLATGCFSHVIALGVLDHLPDPDLFLQAARRLLKPGGRFVASAGGPRHLQELQALAREFLPQQEYGGDAAQFGLQNGRERLAPYFSRVERWSYTDTLVFEEAEPVVDYLLSEQEDGVELDVAAFTSHLEDRLATEGPLRITREKGLFVASINNL